MRTPEQVTTRMSLLLGAYEASGLKREHALAHAQFVLMLEEVFGQTLNATQQGFVLKAIDALLNASKT